MNSKSALRLNSPPKPWNSSETLTQHENYLYLFKRNISILIFLKKSLKILLPVVKWKGFPTIYLYVWISTIARWRHAMDTEETETKQSGLRG